MIGVPARVVLEMVDRNICPQTGCLGVFCSLSTVKMASWHVLLVLPSFPSQEPWQQREFRMMVSQGLWLRHLSCQLVLLGALRGFCSGLVGQLDWGKIEEESRKMEVADGGHPCLRKGLGQGAVSVQKGKGRTGGLEVLRGRRLACPGCCCSICNSDNLQPIRAPLTRMTAH